MRKFILIVSAGCFALSGCAQFQNRAALNSANMACEQAYANPLLDPLKDQVPKDARHASIVQLTDPAMIRPDQKEAVEAIGSVYANCYAATEKYLNQALGPRAAQMYGAMLQDAKQTEVALWGGQITFGQFNTIRAKIVTTFLQAAQEVATRDAIAAQQIQAQRQQAAAALINAARPISTYQAPISPPAFRTTNCYQVGSSVNCTSY